MTLLMGVVNVTPDSFSDAGLWLDPDAAIAHGLQLRAEGADILDVGGESTRPGATRPLVEEELGRVIPVITGLVAQGCVVSVDTMRAEVAAAALSAGASIVNDVSGGLADPEILGVVAGSRARFIAMHWRAHSATMQQHADYVDVVGEVIAELSDRVTAAVTAGIPPERLAIDPGLGFAKQPHHNWGLLRHLDAFEELGLPLLVGASRKSFLGALLADHNGPRPVDQRLYADVAIATMLALRGVWAIRVHDVRAAADALAVVRRWQEEPHD